MNPYLVVAELAAGQSLSKPLPLYLFGAICPAPGKAAALAIPFANTHAMQAHLKEISRQVAAGAHGVILLDRAGWHTTGEPKLPKNSTLIFLPSNPI